MLPRVCKHCGSEFVVTDRDLAFFEKISPVFGGKKYLIPPPTLCPECRFQRRACHRNERNFYLRKCSSAGDDIVTIYSPDKNIPVYQSKIWWSDKWRALSYGRDFDFSRGFFEQWKELRDVVPRLQLLAKNSQNADYTNHAAGNKNCYLSTAVFQCEDVYYSRKVFASKSLLDCLYIFGESELLYECYWGDKLYDCQYCDFCSSSRNLKYCFDCKGCSNCFLSSNLRNKQYMFRNQKLSKEAYELKMKEFESMDFNERENVRKEFELMCKESIHPALHNENVEESEGDFLNSCKQVHDSYYCFFGERLRYCFECDPSSKLSTSRDCMDCFGFGSSELLYEVQAQTQGYNNQFCMLSYEISDCMYCDMCFNVKHCFGCVGLHSHEEYCVLNKQYSREEYELLVSKIIENMGGAFIVDRLSNMEGNSHESKNMSINDKRTTINEYGEFFPSSLSLFAYNESVAQEYHPLSEAEALQQGFVWKKSELNQNQSSECLTCKVCSKLYRILAPEELLYKEMGMNIPMCCPNCRYEERSRKRNSRQMFERSCAKCQKNIQSSYSLNQVEKVYCEACYLELVY